MATNNVNIINITNLPQAQDIVDGNYLVVQNDLGTQIIDWANVYVLKLDPNGNGSTTGTITAVGIDVETALVDTLSTSSIVSDGLAGQTYENDYFNKFTFSNGIATSAFYVTGSPEYEDLTTNVIPAATSYAVNLTLAVFEGYMSPGAGNVNVGTTETAIVFNKGLPDGLDVADLVPSDCQVVYTGNYALSSNPYVSDFLTGTPLQATLYLGQPSPSTIPLTDFSIKISKHYTI